MPEITWARRHRAAIAAVALAAGVLSYIVLLGGYWSEFAQIPLSDPSGYPSLARASSFFYDSGSREPLYIFIVKLALGVIPDEGMALRLLSTVWMAAGFGALTVWVWTRWGLLAAVVAAAAIASNRVAGYYSCQGYNMTAYSCLLMAFALIWMARPKISFWAVGLLGAAAGLTRLEGLAVVAICCGWDIVPDRSWKKSAPTIKAFALAVSLIVPYLLVQKFTHGSFFWSHLGHAEYWLERQGNGILGVGRPGIPGFISQWLYGLVQGLSGYCVKLWQGAYWVPALALIGFWAALRRGDVRELVFFVATLAPVAYILPIDQAGPGSGAELRFVLPLLWPTAWLAARGAVEIRGLIGRKMESGISNSEQNKN